MLGPETILPLDAWLRAFVLTLACEMPVFLRFGRRACPSLTRGTSAVLLANIASHPAVWLIFPRLGLSWGLTTLISEAWAVGVEAWLYAVVFPSRSGRSAIWLSLAANAASFAAGLVLAALGIL